MKRLILSTIILFSFGLTGNSQSHPIIAGNTQDVISSTTLISSFPWTYGFEDSSCFHPDFYGNPLYTEWQYAAFPNNWNFSGSAFAHSGLQGALYNQTFLSNEFPLITPVLQLPPSMQLNFWWLNYSPSAQTQILSCYIVSTNNTLIAFLGSCFVNSSIPVYDHVSFDLSAYGGQDVRIKWVAYLPSSTSTSFLTIDDISVIPLPATGIIMPETDTVTFPQVCNNATISQSFWIKNNGSQALEIDSVRISFPFSCSYSGILLPGQKLNLSIDLSSPVSGNMLDSLQFFCSTPNQISPVIVKADVIPTLNFLGESFDSVYTGNLPTHWNSLATYPEYVSISNNGVNCHTPLNSVEMHNYGFNSNEVMLISPGVSISATDTLQFYARINVAFASKVLVVGLMKNITDPNSFTPLDTFDIDQNIKTYYQVIPAGLDKPYIVFKTIDIGPAYSVFIDDISYPSSNVPGYAIMKGPSQIIPVNTYYPTIKWEKGRGTVTGYRLYAGIDNPPTTILNGLNVGNTTEYHFYPMPPFGDTIWWIVKPYNDHGYATNCPTWWFPTIPDPTIFPPWVENFENNYATETGLYYPWGWGNFNGNSQATWSAWNNVGAPYSGLSKLSINTNTPLPADDWAFSPRIYLQTQNTYRLRFYYKTGPQNPFEENHEKLEVILVNVPNYNASYQQTLFYNDNLLQTTYIAHDTVFSPPWSGLFHLGFRAFSDAFQANILIDYITLDVLVSNETLENNSLIMVYPNPATSTISVETKDPDFRINTITVYNYLGQEVIHTEFEQSNTNVMLNIQYLTPGYYFLKAFMNNTQVSIKPLIIQ